ncbi:hypothetical protein SDC9_19584 [bioreactor metagenome]|uniref:Uncharacterized protein n=1 Tax=bioreactor metagenome TaxID=1076179 RepID=A0A644U4D0_9ZZZZ
MRDRHRHRARHHLETEGAGEQRQQQRPLGHGKAGARADPRAGRERDIGAALRLLAVFALPAGRIEAVRVVPDPLVPVQVPGADHHLRALRHRALAEGLGAARLAHEHRHRRVEPQRLAKHRAAELQPVQDRERRRFGTEDGLRLGRDAVLPVGGLGEQIERPGERRGRGLVPGEEEDRHLIDHLGCSKARAGHRVGGGHDLRRQIVRRGARRDLGRAGGGEALDQRADSGGGAFRRARMKAREPARQRQQRAEIDHRRGVLMGAELVEDGRGGGILDRDREQGAEDHVSCGMRGFRLDLNRFRADLRAQAGDAGLARLPHRGEGVAQPAALEGRVDDPALAQPGLAIGQEHAVAQQWRQPLAHPVGFREIHRSFLQHAGDKRGVVAQEGAEERGAELGHPGAVEARGLRREDIGAKQAEIAPQRHPVWARLGFRGQRCGHAMVV